MPFKILMDQTTNVTVSVTAIPVLELMRVSSADGAWVELFHTEESVRLFSNVEVSKPVNHITSHAQLISEPQTAKDTLVIMKLRNALRVTMVNSQML